MAYRGFTFHLKFCISVYKMLQLYKGRRADELTISKSEISRKSRNCMKIRKGGSRPVISQITRERESLVIDWLCDFMH